MVEHMKKVVIVGLVALLAGSANAVTISLHSSNVGIASMSWSMSGNRIYIWENWTVSDLGSLRISGLDQYDDYRVTKYIRNNTGVDWTRFANELLDPSGNLNDYYYDIPTEPWVPNGFSHSNDQDGLSFAQGSGIPRTSSAFDNLVVDELAGKDFIDFYGGLVSGAGGRDTVKFGLRDNQVYKNEPFLLAQRPNQFTSGQPGQPIPEPATMILFGLGLAGVALRSRFKK
jgi:hypothetical protein